MAGTTFIVDCSVCKAKVAAEEKGRAQQSSVGDNGPQGTRLLVGVCPSCKTLLVGMQNASIDWDSEDEDAVLWSDPVRVYPNPPKTFLSVRIPHSVTASLAEADNSLQANALLAACVMFGRALEAVCRDILYTREEKQAMQAGTSKKRLMLAAGIKQLKEKNFIDDRLYDWSQHLNAFRNLAAHPDDDDRAIPRQDAEDLQAFAYAIVEYIYDLTDRYEEFKERQKKRAKRP
jgi:Domain of unknown function (DUF4145)